MVFKSITYFLANDGNGFLEFKLWYKSCKLLEPIHNNLDTYCTELENTKWLDILIRKQLFENINKLLFEYINNLCGKNPLEYFKDYITDIDEYCFQGGYGHVINYYFDSLDYHPLPHHWRVRPEYYEKVKDIPELILLCVVITNTYIWIDPKPTYAQWSS